MHHEGYLVYGPLSEKAGALPDTDQKNRNKAVVLELDSRGGGKVLISESRQNLQIFICIISSLLNCHCARIEYMVECWA